MNKSASGPWMVRCVAGLGATLGKELLARGFTARKTPLFFLRQRNHDLIFLSKGVRKPPDPSLRIAEMAIGCSIYGRYKISKSQLDRLAEELKNQKRAVRLAVSAEGSHFGRRDLRRWLTQRLAERKVDIAEDGSALTLWVFCVDEAYYAGLAIFSAEEGRFRGDRTAERTGSLPPTIAAAMVFLAVPGSGERILDPACGSGTLLAEAGASDPQATLVGLDIDESALKTAAENLSQQGKVLLLRADFTRCPLNTGRFGLFLGNLPFGKQFGSVEENPRLYRGLFAEMQRLGAHGWRAVVLTSDLAALKRAVAESSELDARRLFRVKVRGEWAEAWQMREKG